MKRSDWRIQHELNEILHERFILSHFEKFIVYRFISEIIFIFNEVVELFVDLNKLNKYVTCTVFLQLIKKTHLSGDFVLAMLFVLKTVVFTLALRIRDNTTVLSQIIGLIRNSIYISIKFLT